MNCPHCNRQITDLQNHHPLQCLKNTIKTLEKETQRKKEEVLNIYCDLLFAMRPDITKDIILENALILAHQQNETIENILIDLYHLALKHRSFPWEFKPAVMTKKLGFFKKILSNKK